MSLSNLAPRDEPVAGLDDPILESIGIRYAPPRQPPTIERDQALHLATQQLGGRADGDTTILAQYVLFTDTHAYQTDDDGQQHYLFQSVPAWVVTFQGIVWPNRGPRGHSPTYNHEVNIVLDAETGEYLHLFTYR